MRSAALLLALLAFGCSNRVPGDDESSIPSPPVATGEFDAQRWLGEARAAVIPLDDAEASGDPAADKMKALADSLDEAVDWRRACDTYLDYETGEEVYDPIAPDLSSWVRGTMDIANVSATEAVVAVTCDFGAYQGSYALVHVDGRSAHLLSTRGRDADGAPLPGRQTTFSTPDFERIGEGAIATFGRARGLGDCGVYATYRLDGDGTLKLVEMRSRDCDDGVPEDVPPPDEWPVVYSAE